MSELPDRTLEAASHTAYADLHCEADDEIITFDPYARRILAAAMESALGPDRLVVAGPLESELEDLRKTLAEVRAQRDEWEQIATGYRARLQASGVGLSNVSS